MSDTNIFTSFDGVDLTTVSGLSVLATKPYLFAKRNLVVAPLARVSKAKINSGFYDKKEIPIRIGIRAQSRDLLEASLDQLATILQGLEKDLIMRQSGGLRRYTASYSDFNVITSGGSYLEGELIFESSDHFGYDINSKLLLQVNSFTSNAKTDQVTLVGSAPFQLPVITITYTALSGSTSKSVTIGNGGNGTAITVTRTFAVNDVLVIDCQNQTVKVNGVDVAFTGAFPEFANGVGYLTYADTFSSRTFNNTTRYTPRYV